MFVPIKTLSAFAAVALIMSGSAASAEEFLSNGKTFEVRYSDLDLSSKADQKKLDSRIRFAAARVCRSYDGRAAAQCSKIAYDHVKAPMAAAIAKAETSERYADASGNVSGGVSN